MIEVAGLIPTRHDRLLISRQEKPKLLFFVADDFSDYYFVH
jgi:hypothetical protein